MRQGVRLGIDVGDVRIGVATCDPAGLVASPLETVARGVADFIARYQPDEVIVTSQIFDHAARLKSFEILTRAMSPA